MIGLLGRLLAYNLAKPTSIDDTLRAKIEAGKQSGDPERARYWTQRERNAIHGTQRRRQVQLDAAGMYTVSRQPSRKGDGRGHGWAQLLRRKESR